MTDRIEALLSFHGKQLREQLLNLKEEYEKMRKEQEEITDFDLLEKLEKEKASILEAVKFINNKMKKLYSDIDK